MDERLLSPVVSEAYEWLVPSCWTPRCHDLLGTALAGRLGELLQANIALPAHPGLGGRDDWVRLKQPYDYGGLSMHLPFRSGRSELEGVQAATQTKAANSPEANRCLSIMDLMSPRHLVRGRGPDCVVRQVQTIFGIDQRRQNPLGKRC